MPQQRWDLASAGASITFPRRIRDAGLPRSIYRERKWQLRGRVTRWMIRTGLRQMNRHYSQHGDPVGAMDAVGRWELQEAARAADRLGVLDTRHQPEWIALDDYDTALCAKAALRILHRIWTPDYIDTASLAGRISKRPPTFTAAQYAQHQYQPHATAAKHMGCSISTVKRLAALVRAMGGAIKASALIYATRVKRLYPEPNSRAQITKEWGTSHSQTGHVKGYTEWRPPP